ncbi:MAG: hypothetical protein GVY28_11645 [Alphaproteobacteria bacterium]|jgi:hypothetical protein|nr:hypothetical protein [Alphaproteobacteria bacterium]
MILRLALNGAVHFAGGIALGALGVLAARPVAEMVRTARSGGQSDGGGDIDPYAAGPVESPPDGT